MRRICITHTHTHTDEYVLRTMLKFRPHWTFFFHIIVLIIIVFNGVDVVHTYSTAIELEKCSQFARAHAHIFNAAEFFHISTENILNAYECEIPLRKQNCFTLPPVDDTRNPASVSISIALIYSERARAHTYTCRIVDTYSGRVLL